MWVYYKIMGITLIVMNNYPKIILSIPSVDRSLQVYVYKVHNLPAMHPQLNVQHQYELEGNYLAVATGGMYASLPVERDIKFCELTQG